MPHPDPSEHTPAAFQLKWAKERETMIKTQEEINKDYDVAFKQATDVINHPLHYGGADNPYETIKVIKAWGLGFNDGNAVKYISRAGKKFRTKAEAKRKRLEDLKKSRWYIDQEISDLEKELNNGKD